MIKKGVLVISLLIAIMFIAGCAVSDYLVGNATEKEPSSEEVNEEDILKEIEDLTKEETGEEETEIEEPEKEKDNSDLYKDLIEGNVEEEDVLAEEGKEEVEEEPEEIEEEVEEEPEEIEEEPSTDLITDKDKYSDEVDYSKDVIKLSVKENEEVTLKPNAKDADLDNLKFTFTEPFNTEGYWKTEYGDAGEYEITVTVSDGVLTTSRKVLLTVERVNVPPVIDILSELEASEGDLVKLSPKVTDPNKDDTTTTISDPVGNDGEWQTGYTDHGTYTVTIEASDGELESAKDVKLTIKRKNMPPEIQGVPASLTINEGETVELEPEVTDLNEDDLTITISDPVGDDGIWETGYTDNGEYTIEVKATDGEATTTKTMKLTVKDINKAPVITDIKLG